MNKYLIVVLLFAFLFVPVAFAAPVSCPVDGNYIINTDTVAQVVKEQDPADPSKEISILKVFVRGVVDVTPTLENPDLPVGVPSVCYVGGEGGRPEKITAFTVGSGSSISCREGPEGFVLNNPTSINADSSGLPIEVYEASCTLDPAMYQGTCVDINVQYVPSDPTSTIRPSGLTIPIRVCDGATNTNAFDALRSMLRQFLSPAGGFGFAQCFAAVMLVGFLLAGMYLSGKSPISLLDITTPRMPSPKGLAAGGQNVVGFGYTELKTTTAIANAKSRAALTGLLGVVGKGVVTGAALKKIGSLAEGIRGSTVKRTANLVGAAGRFTGDELNSQAAFKGLASLAVKYGYEGGKIPSNLAKLITNYSKEELAQAGKILAYADARAASGLERQTIGHIRQLFAGAHMNQTLARVTSVDSAVAGYTGRLTRELVGGDNSHLKSFAPMGRGLHDSFYRGVQVGTGFVKAVAGEVTRAGLAIATGGKTDQAMATLATRAKQGDSVAAAIHKVANATSNDMLPIGAVDKMKDRAGQMFRDLHREAYNDLIRSLLVKLYEKQGVNFKMTKEQFLAFAHKDVDILKMAGYHGQTALLDKQVLKILSDHNLSPTQKVDALRRLSETYGVTPHATIVQEQSFLDHLLHTGDKGDDHVRLVTIYRHVQDHHEMFEKTGARAEGFRYTIAKDHLSHEEQWQVLNLRRLMYDAENGHVAKDTGIHHVLMGSYLHMTNSLIGLAPTANATGLKQLKAMLPDGEFEAIQKRNMLYLKELLTADGHAWLKKFGGSANNLEDLAKLFTTQRKIMDERGFSEQAGPNKVFGLGAQGVIGAKGEGKFGGADFAETGPIAGAWRIDMKRNWNLGYNESASFETVQWYYNRLYRGQREYHDLDVERAVNAKFGVKSSQQIGAGQESAYRHEYRKELISSSISKETNNFFNMFAQNTYTDARNTFHMYMKAMGGILARGFEDTEKSKAAHRDDIRFIEEMNPMNRADMERFAKMLKDNEKQFSAWMDKPVTYRDISHAERPWIMLYEGSLVPYVKGMPLSPNDRPLGGRVALFNGKNWEAFDPHMVKMDFEKYATPAMGAQFRQLLGVQDYAKWEPFIKQARDVFMKHGFEGEKIFNALLTHASKTTGNYLDPMQYGTIRIVPKRQAAPSMPNLVHFFTDESVNTEPFRRIRNAFLGMGDSVSRMALVTSGDALRASYEINVVSEIYRQASWNLVMQIYNTDWDKEFSGLSSDQRKRYKDALYEFADSYGPYLDIWQRAIDRAPNRFDTSTGIHQKYSSVFNFGPGFTFDVRQNVKNYYTKSEYVQFMAQGGFLMIGAQQLSKPFVQTFRSIQQSMSGDASRWDYTARDVFHTQDPTLPRWRSVMASMSFLQTVGNLAQKDSYFQNPEVVRHLAGPVMGGGMKVTRHEMMHILKGTESHARTGDANPGLAHLDFRHTLKLAGGMGSYATSTTRMGKFGAFYSEDPYLARQANQNEIKRTVSAESLAIRREEELAVNRNNPHKLWTPFGFVYGFPVAPDYSLRELVGKATIAHRTGQGINPGAGIVKSAKDVGQGISSMAKRQLTSTCRHCGHGGAVGSARCASCGGVRQF